MITTIVIAIIIAIIALVRRIIKKIRRDKQEEIYGHTKNDIEENV